MTVEQYTLRPYKEHDTICSIRSGKFVGVQFQYGQVKFLENEDTGECTLNYEFVVHENPENLDI